MRSESNLVYEIWEILREHIPAAKRADAAVSLIKNFSDFGFEKEDFADAVEECEVLRTAHTFVYSHDEDEEPDYDYED